MPRILIIGRAFPDSKHGYINNDVEYLAGCATVLVLSPHQPMAPYYSPIDFNYFGSVDELLVQARQFKPDFIVSWLLPNHHYARRVAEALGVPFVLKLHTPDYHTLTARRSLPRRLATHLLDEVKLSKHYMVSKASLRKTAHSPWLRGVYCIAGLRKEFEKFFPAQKLLDLQPRIFFDRFHDESPNGERVMVLGALLSRREGIQAFSSILSSIDGPVDWYPMPTPGCLWLDIPNLPANLAIRKYVPPGDMPAIYKQYKAMVMIGSGRYSRGMSLSVLEAQAAGVAVVAPSLRPDFDDFVLNGGGYIFRDESELPGILRQLPDPARRESGFRHASQFDIGGVRQELALAGLTL